MVFTIIPYVIFRVFPRSPPLSSNLYVRILGGYGGVISKNIEPKTLRFYMFIFLINVCLKVRILEKDLVGGGEDEKDCYGFLGLSTDRPWMVSN